MFFVPEQRGQTTSLAVLPRLGVSVSTLVAVDDRCPGLRGLPVHEEAPVVAGAGLLMWVIDLEEFVICLLSVELSARDLHLW